MPIEDGKGVVWGDLWVYEGGSEKEYAGKTSSRAIKK